MTQEPGELEGKGGPEVGIDRREMVCDGLGLRDESGASRHLGMEGCRLGPANCCETGTISCTRRA